MSNAARSWREDASASNLPIALISQVEGIIFSALGCVYSASARHADSDSVFSVARVGDTDEWHVDIEFNPFVIKLDNLDHRLAFQVSPGLRPEDNPDSPASCPGLHVDRRAP